MRKISYCSKGGYILQLAFNFYLVSMCTLVFIIILSKRKYEILPREWWYLLYRLKLFWNINLTSTDKTVFWMKPLYSLFQIRLWSNTAFFFSFFSFFFFFFVKKDFFFLFFFFCFFFFCILKKNFYNKNFFFFFFFFFFLMVNKDYLYRCLRAGFNLLVKTWPSPNYSLLLLSLYFILRFTWDNTAA